MLNILNGRLNLCVVSSDNNLLGLALNHGVPSTVTFNSSHVVLFIF